MGSMYKLHEMYVTLSGGLIGLVLFGRFDVLTQF